MKNENAKIRTKRNIKKVELEMYRQDVDKGNSQRINKSPSKKQRLKAEMEKFDREHDEYVRYNIGIYIKEKNKEPKFPGINYN